MASASRYSNTLDESGVFERDAVSDNKRIAPIPCPSAPLFVEEISERAYYRTRGKLPGGAATIAWRTFRDERLVETFV